MTTNSAPPSPDDLLTWATALHDSPAGRIRLNGRAISEYMDTFAAALTRERERADQERAARATESNIARIAVGALMTAQDERDALRADAERWDRLCDLWHESTELALTQDEDGRWSITQVEDVEGARFRPLTGDTPDAAIDAAKGKA